MRIYIWLYLSFTLLASVWISIGTKSFCSYEQTGLMNERLQQSGSAIRGRAVYRFAWTSWSMLAKKPRIRSSRVPIAYCWYEKRPEGEVVPIRLTGTGTRV